MLASLFLPELQRTLAYGAVFGQAVPLKKLKLFWVGNEVRTQSEIDQVVGEVIAEGRVRLRRKSLAASNEKWQQIQDIRVLAQSIPWIQSIWITGSMAAGTAADADDIDLMVVADERRLWLVRALFVTAAWLFGRYRRSGDEPQQWRNRWCCNLWLEPRTLALNQSRQTLFSARELVQTFPIYVRQGVRPTALHDRNQWARQWCATGWRLARARAESCAQSWSFSSVFLRQPVWSWLWSGLNFFVQQLQISHAKKRQTREVFDAKQAFFHPRDTQSQVLQQYERICQVYGVSPWPDSDHKHSKNIRSRRTGRAMKLLVG